MITWYKIAESKNIPEMGSRTVVIGDVEIAVFKTKNGSIFAVNNLCPHKQGKLSEGLVHDEKVTCPLHNWDIDLKTGNVIDEENFCANIYTVKIEDNFVYISLDLQN